MPSGSCFVEKMFQIARKTALGCPWRSFAVKTGTAEFGTAILTTWKKLLRHTSAGAVLFAGKPGYDWLFAMQKHRKIRNVPFPRPCGATGHDARNLHALSFVQVRGALFMQEALWRMRRHIEIPAPSIAYAFSSSRMNMMKKLTASSAQETQMPRSAMCADNSAPSPAPMANRPMTPK